MSRPLPLALVQAAGVPGSDVSAFSASLELLTRTHSRTKLFVYPELHLNHLGDAPAEDVPAMIKAMAEPLDGPTGRVLAQLAGDLNIWLVPGSFYERGADGKIYNTSVAYSPQGKRVASYRKIFPWRPYERVAAGSEFVVFDMAGIGRVGLSICYDAWFPESSRHLAWMGADLILNVVQTPTSDRAQEVTIAKANAIVNQVFVASVNAAGPEGLGRSLLVDPQGRVRVESETAESRVLTDVIDLDDVSNAREYGTAGVTRPWRQFDEFQDSLDLPLYSGRLDPTRWSPITEKPGLEESGIEESGLEESGTEESEGAAARTGKGSDS
ncbi:carbon-nitrogen hydrolase family protein [Arthrobacter sp. SIMBA_036]|uniref:carbon-nitrogen hydrolase family protein n=1 Tax=Arthrobacter sp. SIMBA_036 TaxID=3085778 RepID=UPI0039796594